MNNFGQNGIVRAELRAVDRDVARELAPRERVTPLPPAPLNLQLHRYLTCGVYCTSIEGAHEVRRLKGVPFAPIYDTVGKGWLW